MASKGDKQRVSQVPMKTYDANHDRIFKKKIEVDDVNAKGERLSPSFIEKHSKKKPTKKK